MKLRLRLVEDGKTVFEVPLCPTDWPKQELEQEFEAAEEDFQRFSMIFDALAHKTRLRMMRRLVQEEPGTMSFGGFMKDLDLNPKTVWENSKKLEESGLLEKLGRGKYGCSEFGQTAFMMMSLALHRLMESLEEMESI
jgi:DNA-binding transcriptional ArsR family regulator